MPAGDMAQAQRLYKSGMDLYGKQQYPEALSAFNRAITLGDRSWKVMDAKAATMNRMGGAWRQSAYEVAKGLCKKYGDKSHRPWYRVASIMVSLNMFDVAEKSIQRGLSLTNDAGARKVLLDLRAQGQRVKAQFERERAASAAEAAAQRLADAKANMCFAHLLTPDVLLQITDLGLADDPDMPLRMAGVCAQWRAVMLERTSLWRHLRVARRRPTAKARLWVDRSGGRLRELSLSTDYLTAEQRAEVADTLAPYVSSVETLTIAGDGREYHTRWEGRFLHLKKAVIRNNGRLFNRSPVLSTLLHPDACSLKTFEIDFVDMIGTAAPSLDEPALWFPQREHFQCLEHLRIGSGSIRNPQLWLPSLVSCACKLQKLELGTTCPFPSRPYNANVDGSLTLPHLTHLDLKCDGGVDLPFTAITVPALTNLSCYGFHTHRTGSRDFLLNLRGPGLEAALPNLVSLDIGRCIVDQGAFIALLPTLKALRFLNVSFTGVDNAFLEALVVKPSEPTLLPQLTALSIAGHDRITAGPLHRFIRSRREAKPATTKPASQTPAPVPKRAAFAPARSAFAPVRKAQATRRSTPTPSRTPSASSLSTQAPEPVAPITWICLDQCNSLEVGVIEDLRRHLRFVSNSSGSVVPDRIRGRSAYAWDREGDWDASCNMGACHLRKRRADDEGWYVHHTCKRARNDQRLEQTGVEEDGLKEKSAPGWQRRV